MDLRRQYAALVMREIGITKSDEFAAGIEFATIEDTSESLDLLRDENAHLAQLANAVFRDIVGLTEAGLRYGPFEKAPEARDWAAEQMSYAIYLLSDFNIFVLESDADNGPSFLTGHQQPTPLPPNKFPAASKRTRGGGSFH